MDMIVSPLQLLLDRANEWVAEDRIIVFGGDVLAAFDNLSPEVAAASLASARVHPRIIAAILYELVALSCSPEFADLTCQERVNFNRCVRQGGVESPYLWNTTMYAVLDELVPSWEARGWGIFWGTRWFTHLVWADNIWLLSRDLRSMQHMIDELSRHAIATEE